ncbi:MAG: prepilin-type N-terminal cleavage/methylation domain-containing protein [Kiritimatiellaeota bacterium]|nr:prepilin-type N-terminal cleavage/methylation domain-containing protein [Kiritimatiellota bacterium]
MRKNFHSESRAGFSLLEIILVLLLIGIVGAGSAPLFSRVVVATVQGAVEQQTAEEAYWAAARMTSLLGVAVDGDASTPGQLRVGFFDVATSTTNYSTFAFLNGQITYNGVLFWDQVASFAAAFQDSLFEIDVQLVDTNHPVISLDVFARNSL